MERLWGGGSAGAFGLMGGYAARARRPWLLLLAFTLWEINVEAWFLRSYTPAFHLTAMAVGFLWVRYGMKPPRPAPPEAVLPEFIPGRAAESPEASGSE
jgi:hypothetical protein